MNEKQYKLDPLTSRVNEAEERINDVEDKLMERKEVEKKREKQLMAHGEGKETLERLMMS